MGVADLTYDDVSFEVTYEVSSVAQSIVDDDGTSFANELCWTYESLRYQDDLTNIASGLEQIRALISNLASYLQYPG